MCARKRLALFRVGRWLLDWPLWGVLLCGLASALLYEHGCEWFAENLVPVWLLLIALPIVADGLTPEKPCYTAVVFAIGSVPPVNDATPVPIGTFVLD